MCFKSAFGFYLHHFNNYKAVGINIACLYARYLLIPNESQKSQTPRDGTELELSFENLKYN